MRTKVTLVLLFLNVVLFFFIFHFERDWRTERGELLFLFPEFFVAVVAVLDCCYSALGVVFEG